MDADKAAKMTAVLETIQQRWGTRALQSARHVLHPLHVLPGVHTGFPALDVLVPTGIPRSHTTELLGAPTSGVLSLAYGIIASAQSEKRAPKTDHPTASIYVDLEETFDAAYATRCGVQLKRLFLVRPDTPLEGFDIARELLLSGQVDVLVFDLGSLTFEEHLLRRLTQALTNHRNTRSSCHDTIRNGARCRKYRY